MDGKSSWSAGVGVTVPLWAWSKTGRRSAATSRLDEAKAELQLEKAELSAEVRKLFHSFEDAIRVLALAVVFFLGIQVGTGNKSGESAGDLHAGHDHGGAVTETAGKTVWTCSMHPQIKMPKSSSVRKLISM
jgi:hypothetical protein